MPYQTRRRLRRDLEGARTDANNARAELRKAEAQYDNDRRQLGRQIADRDERIAQLEAACRDSSDSIRILLDSLRLLGGPKTMSKPMPRPGRRLHATPVDLVKRGGAA